MKTFKQWLAIQEAFDPHEDDPEDELSYANAKANARTTGSPLPMTWDDDDDDFDVMSRSKYIGNGGNSKVEIPKNQSPLSVSPFFPPAKKPDFQKPVFNKQGPLNGFMSARKSMASTPATPVQSEPIDKVHQLFQSMYGFSPDSESGEKLLKKYGMRRNKNGVLLLQNRAMKKAISNFNYE